MNKESSLSKASALIVLTLFVSSGWAFETDQNSIIKGNLTLDPNAVSDTSAKQGNLTVQGDTILGSDTTVSGVLTAESNLSVAGTTTSYGDVNVAGDLWVGTTDQNFNNGGIYNKTGTVSYISLNHGDGAGGGSWFIGFNYNGAEIGGIFQNQTTVGYVTNSDQRLKTNIQDAEDAGSKIDAIQVRQFDWKSDGSHQDYGMIAQELYRVAPEAVTKSDNPEDMMGVDYSKLVPMLVKEIQSLRQRVEQLENSQ